MICVTLGFGRHGRMEAEYHQLKEQRAKLVELRLDHLTRNPDPGRLLKDRPIPAIVSCRRESDGGLYMGSEDERMVLIRSAIVAKTDYIELEEDIAASVPRFGDTKRIVSYYDTKRTPDDLEEIHARLMALDADVIKICAHANSFSDNAKMMSLVKSSKVPTIGICTGKLGTPSRIMQCCWGAPFTYGTLRGEGRLPDGELDWRELKNVFRAHRANGKTVHFGIVSYPADQSYNSLIHNKCFREHRLNCQYVPFCVPIEDLEEFIDSCSSFGIKGLSVTSPHREEVMEYLNQIESSSHEIGAVNSVQFRGEERRGYNTDFRAAMDCIIDAVRANKETEHPLDGIEFLVLGTDGIAPAIAWGLRQRGAGIFVSGKDGARAEAVASSVGGKAVAWDLRHEPEPRMIINATTTGAHPEVNETPYDISMATPRMIFFETVYKPERTLLVKQAREKGCQVVTGVDLLVRQAAYQYKLFTGQKPPIKTIRDVITKANLAAG